MKIQKNVLRSLGLAAALALTACGAPQESGSELDIINGTTPSDNGLIEQSTVALVSPNGQTFCTGTLIDARYVISAAHCLYSYSGDLYIGFGRNSSEFQYVRSNGFAVHPSYNGSFFKSVPADISVIRLEADAPSGYNPVSVYKGSLSGQDIYLAGFGQTERGGSGQLFYTAVGLSSSTSSEITVFENNTGACYGDSGGPAYIYTGTELQVVGATSRGQQGCRGSSVYSYVPYFESWLESTTGLNL